MKISVITPSCNSVHGIEAAIKSVLAQNYENFEHIIMDAASTDGTVEILKRYPHLIWRSESDDGQVDAIHKAFKIASGDAFVMLNADDVLLPGAFDTVLPFLEKGEDFVVGNVRCYKTLPNGEIINWVNVPKTDFISMMRHWEPDAFCYNPVGYYFSRAVMEQVPFEIKYKDKHDIAFLLTVALKFKLIYVDVELGNFFMNDATITGKAMLSPAYFSSGNFEFIHDFVKYLPEDYIDDYYVERQRKYCMRRFETMWNIFAHGDALPFFTDKSISFFPSQIFEDSFFAKCLFVEYKKIFPAAHRIIAVDLGETYAGNKLYASLLKIQEGDSSPYCIYPIDQRNSKSETQVSMYSQALLDVHSSHEHTYEWLFLFQKAHVTSDVIEESCTQLQISYEACRIAQYKDLIVCKSSKTLMVYYSGEFLHGISNVELFFDRLFSLLYDSRFTPLDEYFPISPLQALAKPLCVDFSRKSHYSFLRKHYALNPLSQIGGDPLKNYQDLVLLKFIEDNVPLGGKILEVGGGNSRVLERLHDRYECWNLDKFEGVGNGPKHCNEQLGIRIVENYLGNFDERLPKNYFDCVFSISVLEHVEPSSIDDLSRLMSDMLRVIKPSGLLAHTIDAVLSFTPLESSWVHPIIPHIYDTLGLSMPSVDFLRNHSDLHSMSENEYNASWKSIIKKDFAEYGSPMFFIISWQNS